MTLSKNKIKLIASLQIKKFRQKYNKFVVEGDKMVRELLQAPGWKTQEVYAVKSWLEQHAGLMVGGPVEALEVEDESLKKISSVQTPNQVLAVVELPAFQMDKAQVARSLSLYLDGIQDPGNCGTILRIADWFGIRHVFCSQSTVDLFNPKVIQASMGAFLRVNAGTMDLPALRQEFPGLTFWGADMDGQNVFEAPAPSAMVLVIGNEGSGIAPEHLPLMDNLLAVPRTAGTGAESLNAAVATGILCAVLRDRHK